MILLHPETDEAFERFSSKPSHAVLLSGRAGSGKRFAAIKLAEMILGQSVDNNPYFLSIEPSGKAITIDQIRELQNFVKLKTAGTAAIRRVIVLADAHLMTVEAQNALLKLLEEPPQDTILILTVQGESSLKPTIYSRTQKIRIKPITKTQAKEWSDTIKSSEADFEKAYIISGGDAALFSSLLKGSKDHDLTQAIAIGKRIIIKTPYERLMSVDELTKDKDALEMLLVGMKKITEAALKQASVNKDTAKIIRWKKNLAALYECEKGIQANGNAKLILTDLFINL